MTTTSANVLAASMKSGFDERPAGRLRGLLGQASPVAIAVPLNQDAYEIAIEHIESDPQQPRKTFDNADFLNGQYTVFGKVASGMEFVDAIKAGAEANNGAVDNPDKIISAKIEYK